MAGSTSVNSSLALLRYNSSGTVDTTFGSGGKVTTDLGSSTDVAYGVAVQTDGMILLCGESGGNVAVVRYTKAGVLDTTFNKTGKVVTDFGGATDRAYSMAIGSDGKIIVAGQSDLNGTNTVLARYNLNGSLDTSFDTDGKVITDVGGVDSARKVMLQTDGKILVAGVSNNDFSLVRYLGSGALDSLANNDSYAYSASNDQFTAYPAGGAASFNYQRPLAQYQWAGALTQGSVVNFLRPAADAGKDSHSYSFYDNSGRVTGVIDGENFLTENTYEASGNLIQRTRYADKVTANFTATTSMTNLRPVNNAAQDQTQTWRHDARGRLILETSADGTQTSYTYGHLE